MWNDINHITLAGEVGNVFICLSEALQRCGNNKGHFQSLPTDFGFHV